jgi:hypothetical protein
LDESGLERLMMRVEDGDDELMAVPAGVRSADMPAQLSHAPISSNAGRVGGNLDAHAAGLSDVGGFDVYPYGFADRVPAAQPGLWSVEPPAY